MDTIITCPGRSLAINISPCTGRGGSPEKVVCWWAIGSHIKSREYTKRRYNIESTGSYSLSKVIYPIAYWLFVCFGSCYWVLLLKGIYYSIVFITFVIYIFSFWWSIFWGVGISGTSYLQLKLQGITICGSFQSWYIIIIHDNQSKQVRSKNGTEEDKECIIWAYLDLQSSVTGDLLSKESSPSCKDR